MVRALVIYEPLSVQNQILGPDVNSGGHHSLHLLSAWRKRSKLLPMDRPL